MKLTINTSAKAVEVANYLLSQAIRSCANEKVREGLSISKTDVENAEKFKKSLVKALLAGEEDSPKESV